MKTWLIALLALTLLVRSSSAKAEPPEGDVVGKPAPAWAELRWLGMPLKLEALRGKAVLIRWWSNECPLCRSTLPGLGRLYEEHEKDGLVVVGVYHPKPEPRPVSEAEVKKFADNLGIRFPVAIDADWTVLKRYWLTGRKRAFTSVSFLIDRKGIIRWVHRGGEFHESRDPDHKNCDAAWQDLQRVLKRVLSERLSPA